MSYKNFKRHITAESILLDTMRAGAVVNILLHLGVLDRNKIDNQALWSFYTYVDFGEGEKKHDEEANANG